MGHRWNPPWMGCEAPGKKQKNLPYSAKVKQLTPISMFLLMYVCYIFTITIITIIRVQAMAPQVLYRKIFWFLTRRHVHNYKTILIIFNCQEWVLSLQKFHPAICVSPYCFLKTEFHGKDWFQSPNRQNVFYNVYNEWVRFIRNLCNYRQQLCLSRGAFHQPCILADCFILSAFQSNL